MQLNIRDDEVQRLNGRVRQLQSEIREMQLQIDMRDEKVCVLLFSQ